MQILSDIPNTGLPKSRYITVIGPKIMQPVT